MQRAVTNDVLQFELGAIDVDSDTRLPGRRQQDGGNDERRSGY